ncbi:ABC transporter substrate-binding protein [Athalassotoga saccharophila]|uniref:ABC transporter substrate-binding protein n=1 Tax=Athalassotoga saccharophila TaxID=1441386 RepID=UPI001379C6D8|nr:ABC transporter substrate-binding protein [Athalassotoga saccharophila]BBJ27291.1 oligopeptide-binding protein AppA [Athalassotoga saccharophila]
MKFKFLILMVALIGILSIGFADVSYPYLTQYGPAIVNWGSNVKYGGTLKIILAYGPLQYSLNPFTGSGSTLPTNLIYESLFYIDMSGKITNFLGTSYKWMNNNTELDVTIRQGVKWSDGVPFTPQDVVFTFNYLKANPAIDLNGIWAPSNDLVSVTASGDTVIFKLSKPNMSIFQYIAGEPIVPEHIWANISDPSKYTNQNPVGTGPFLFKSFDQPTNTVTYIKNPNYWMEGRPYIDSIVYTSVDSNNACTLSLIRHEYDISNLYIPDVMKTYVSHDPANNKYWWPVVGNNYLDLNTTKYPFNIPDFRKAISIAINRKFVLDSLYFGTFEEFDNPTLITYPLRSWLDPTLTPLASSLVEYNPQKAQELLASIGFKKNDQGLLVGPDGKVLPSFTLNVVSGWTDWIQGAQIVAKELGSIGLQVNVSQQSFGQYYSSLQTGTFDMAITWLDPGTNPYNAYYFAFSPNQTAPIGQNAASNFSRYTNPLITDALDVFNSTSDPRIQRQAIYAIERIVLDDMPSIALLPVPMWDVYQTTTLTGFPNDQYPYYLAGSVQVNLEIPALNIHLK